MITKQQALTANEFHLGPCKRTVGPRGGVTVKSNVWRRNGKTQTWVTRPNDFRIPVKYGLRTCGAILDFTAENWHTAEDCPLLQATTRFQPGDNYLIVDNIGQRIRAHVISVNGPLPNVHDGHVAFEDEDGEEHTVSEVEFSTLIRRAR
jgi:hypothetical protein